MIKKSFAQAMSELHTWGGLVFGWLLFAVFLTGTLAVFEPELTHWMQPGLRASQAPQAQALVTAEQKLRQLAPQADAWTIALPQNRQPALEIGWNKGKIRLTRQLDPLTGATLQEYRTEGGHFFADFHYTLHSGKTGIWLVSLASVIMLAALLSGIVIRPQIFSEFFRLRWRNNWLNVHTMTGVLTLPFVILIVYTGLIITFFTLMPLAPQLLYGKQWPGTRASVAQNFDRLPANDPAALLPLTQLLPLAEQELGAVNAIAFIQVKNPGDRQAVITFMRGIDGKIAAIADHASFDGVTGEVLGSQITWNKYAYFYRSLVGLHVAKFGGYPLSWLYFTAGVISSVMIAAGLVFFTVKRHSRYIQSSEIAQFMYRCIAALNTTAITGIVIACAAYLWANRLLPAAMLNRADGESTAFFAVWLLTLLHALYRPPHQAWNEQLQIAAGLCIGLPVLNALTTNVGLPAAITRGDWMTAGVDLTALLLGVGLAIAAWYTANISQYPADRSLQQTKPAKAPRAGR